MKLIENIYYTEEKSPMQSINLYLPEKDKFPVFLYMHGGGIVHGDKSVHSACMESLAQKGIAVLSINYRLYPNAKFPDFIEDGASAFKWARDNMKNYGTPASFFIGGSSAGGYITQMLCFDKKYLAKHGIDADTVDGYIMDAGQPTAHFNVLAERGIDSRRIIVDDTAPLFHITADRVYAPMQIIVSQNDIHGRFEQTQLLLSALKHFEHDMKKVDYRYMEGFSHCKYIDHVDANGSFIFADMLFEFISEYGKL